MQPFSDDIRNYAGNIKYLCRCRQVQADDPKPILRKTLPFLCLQEITLQVVLVTDRNDGNATFAIYNYEPIPWTGIEYEAVSVKIALQ